MQHDFVLPVGEDQPGAWTQRCARHCDEPLLLADAAQPPALHATERAFLLGRPPSDQPQAEAAEVRVLLHGPQRAPAGQVGRWLQRRLTADQVQVRLQGEQDFERLARL